MAQNKDGGWEEEVSGGFIKFDEVGVGFSGLVIGYQKKSTPKGDAHDYRIITKNGPQSFYAPKDLHEKLSGVIIRYGLKNAIVKATFKETIKTGSGNDFKKFEVLSKKADPESLKELGIDPDAESNY